MLETSLGYDGNGNYNVGDPHVNLLILSTPIISSDNGGASSCLIQMLWIYSCGSKWLVCFAHEETFVLLVVSYNWGNCCSVPGVTVMGCCCQRVLMGGSNGPCLVSLHHWFSALWYSLKTLSLLVSNTTHLFLYLTCKFSCQAEVNHNLSVSLSLSLAHWRFNCVLASAHLSCNFCVFFSVQSLHSHYPCVYATKVRFSHAQHTHP